jgi:hypothetical protein
MLILLGLLLVGCVALAAVARFIARDRAFDSMPTLPRRDRPVDSTKTIKIGIIGESWAAGQKTDLSLRNALAAVGMEVEVVSSGQPGATTRLIYRNLLADESQPNSSRGVLMDEDVDYLVVLAGVNDAASHIGRNFYAHHMLCIIAAARMRGIHPIVLEVPEFGIEEIPSGGLLSSAKRLIYRTFFDGTRHDVIADYRAALRAGVASDFKDEVTLIPFGGFIEDYSEMRHLYRDAVHLTAEGWHLLGEFLAENLEIVHRDQLRRVSPSLALHQS